jgi:pyruvate/2-oxoglutarate dehydrogenase complex dihydrolipoamide dehydrogenase (E3) component
MTQAHEQYDAIIIGVGQAGNPLATALSQAGWKTAVIERRFVGSVTVSLAEVRRRKQAIVDTSRGNIHRRLSGLDGVGCAMLGIAGGEIMSMIEIAMMGHLPYTALRDGVFAHPTLAESLNTLFDQLA